MDHHHHHSNEVDLHILVVPESQWRPDLRLAYSTTCMASVSAGFVRVDPNVSLVELRGEISRQLDGTSLPESYIFLRCVGRYLCTVSRNQELSLSSKLFVPPLAACPEIYLLNASLTEETTSSFPPTHLPPNPLPTLHRSPQHTGNQHYPSTYTTSPVSSHHTVGHLSPLTSSHPSPSSHILSASHSQHPHHSTSNYARRSLEGSNDGGDWEEGSGNLSPGAPHSQGYHRGLLSQGRADSHHHATVQPSKKNRSVHFETPITFGADTPSPSTIPDTTTVDFESLALSPSFQQSDVQGLLVQIKKVKDECKRLSVLKENLSSKLRQLQHQMQAHKEKSNSEWKQKLENEKKQTRKLEKALRKLRADVDAVDPVTTTTKKKSQKKLSVGTEQQEKESKSSVAKSESDHTNLKLECKRVDLDMQQLRKTRDEEKQKLKVEQEKHQSIVDECKALKKELNQLKVAQNRLKNK